MKYGKVVALFQQKTTMLLLLLICFNFALSGQTIAAWNMSTLTGGMSSFGPSPFNATSTGSNVTVGGLTRGSGIGTSGTGAANAWGGNDFTGTSVANAITLNEFSTFTIAPNSGYSVSLSQIEAYNIRRSGTGPTMGQWQYSLDGGSFTNIGGPITWGSTTTAAGNAQAAINLSGILDLQSVSSPTVITFRVVVWGATGTGGTWYINDPTDTTSPDFVVSGNIALPVELESFQVNSLQAGVPLLSWRTATEQNNAFFDIERSADGRSFEAIGRVAGQGDSSAPVDYTFVDAKPLAGLSYYRLRQVDYDGAFAYYGPLSVNREGLTPGVSQLWPIPAQDRVWLQLATEPSANGVEITLYDLSGQLQWRRRIADKSQLLEIPLTKLPAGIYLLRWYDGSYIGQHRLIVE